MVLRIFKKKEKKEKKKQNKTKQTNKNKKREREREKRNKDVNLISYDVIICHSMTCAENVSDELILTSYDIPTVLFKSVHFKPVYSGTYDR